jgi:DNA (cytosine-5)-methyltransferase 1
VEVKLYWWTKAKRAQNINDYESWNEGGVTPTLNAMDNNGEAYATVLILFEPKSLFEENWSESKVKNALRANASKSSHLIIDGTRVDDVRVYEDGIVPTVISRYGTGGGNVPMIFSHTQGLDAQPSEENSPTLRTGGGGMAVAYSIREDAKANNFSATETDTALAVQALQPSPQSHHAQMFIAEPTMAVRRLTPLECERLMGWPDDHTRYKADGTEQADTHRYKQCGNGVASPVAQWIAKHILAI